MKDCERVTTDSQRCLCFLDGYDHRLTESDILLGSISARDFVFVMYSEYTRASEIYL